MTRRSGTPWLVGAVILLGGVALLAVFREDPRVAAWVDSAIDAVGLNSGNTYAIHDDRGLLVVRWTSTADVKVDWNNRRLTPEDYRVEDDVLYLDELLYPPLPLTSAAKQRLEEQGESK